MASFDSAKGPSETFCPFLPETILPSGSSGSAPIILPCSANRSNHAFHFSIILCSVWEERFWFQSVPRNNNKYSDEVCVLIFAFLYCSSPDQPFTLFGYYHHNLRIGTPGILTIKRARLSLIQERAFSESQQDSEFFAG